MLADTPKRIIVVRVPLRTHGGDGMTADERAIVRRGRWRLVRVIRTRFVGWDDGHMARARSALRQSRREGKSKRRGRPLKLARWRFIWGAPAIIKAVFGRSFSGTRVPLARLARAGVRLPLLSGTCFLPEDLVPVVQQMIGTHGLIRQRRRWGGDIPRDVNAARRAVLRNMLKVAEEERAALDERARELELDED